MKVNRDPETKTPHPRPDPPALISTQGPIISLRDGEVLLMRPFGSCCWRGSEDEERRASARSLSHPIDPTRPYKP